MTGAIFSEPPSLTRVPGPDSRRRGRLKTIAVTLVFALLLIAPLRGQDVVVGGIVTNAQGQPLDQVSVLVGGELEGTTDNGGRFLTRPLPTVNQRLRVVWRRIGYTPWDTTLTVTADTAMFLTVTLDALPVQLEEITVEGSTFRISNPGMVGFYNRQADGLGSYLTEPEIRRRGLVDLAPHLQRLMRASGGPNCMIGDRTVVFLDGVPFFDLQALRTFITPGQVEGIEVYNKNEFDQLPAEFILPVSICRVVMVWTREQPPATGDVFKGPGLGLAIGPTLGSPPTTFFLTGRLTLPVWGGPETLNLLVDGGIATGDEIDWRGSVAATYRLSEGPRAAFLIGGIAVTDSTTSGRAWQAVTGVGYSSIRGRVQPWLELRFVGRKPQSILGISLRFGAGEYAEPEN